MLFRVEAVQRSLFIAAPLGPSVGFLTAVRINAHRARQIRRPPNANNDNLQPRKNDRVRFCSKHEGDCRPVAAGQTWIMFGVPVFFEELRWKSLTRAKAC